MILVLSSAKLEEGMFSGPQIRVILKNKDFEELLTINELRALDAFNLICHGYLCNIRELDY